MIPCQELRTGCIGKDAIEPDRVEPGVCITEHDAREQIDDAVAVNVRRGRAFSVFESAALITALAGCAGINRREWPQFGVARVSGDVRGKGKRNQGERNQSPADKVRMENLRERK